METFGIWAGAIVSVIGIIGAAFAVFHRCSAIILNQDRQAERHNELCENVERLQEDVSELRKSEAKINVIWEAVMKGAVGRLCDRGLISDTEEELS